MNFNLLSILFLGSLFPFLSPLFAMTTDEALGALSAQKRNSFLKEKQFVEVAPKKRPLYLPAFLSEGETTALGAEIKKVSPNIAIEGLFLIPKGRGVNMLYFYNSLLAIKEFGKVTYFNEEAKLTHPLFGFSYAIADRESKREIADPIAREMEASREVLVYQDFRPTSYVVSEYQYSYQGGRLNFKGVTLDPVKYKGFTGIGAGRLVIHILVQETDDAYVVYALAYSRVASLFGRGERLFTYRIKGLVNWYFETYLSHFIR